MRFDTILDTLAKSNKHVFTVYDAAKLMGKPVPYTSLMLSKSKKVVRIERGKYFLESTDTYKIASNIVFPSYISLQAGLQYYGLIDQNVATYSVIALKRHKTIHLNGLKIEFIRTNKKWFYGYRNVNGVYIASLEKLFIDCIRFGRVRFSTLKEALEVAMSEKSVDIRLIERYAIEADSGVLANKMGFLLGTVGTHAEKLIPYRYHNYVDMHGTGNKGMNKEWRVKYD